MISFNCGKVYMNQNFQSPEVGLKSDPRQSEHNHDVKTLSEKLEEALANIKAKEELVKQHVKVAEEAVSGWEKSEREVSALRQQVEVLTVRNSTLEDRIGQLDGALKECLRQLRQTREEKDQIAHEALEKKNSETESSSTSIDNDLLHKLEMSEKENEDLKLELSSMAEELEIRLIERELSNQAAEQASKQLLESVKKVAKLEAECHRLNFSLQKGNNNERKAHEKAPIKGRNKKDSLVKIELMDDFLEMERLVGLPESSEVEERSKKVEKEHENELMTSRKQIKEVEYKLVELENEVKASRERLKEAEFKSVGLENELKSSTKRLEECECKFVETKNELKASRKRLKEVESKLDGRENELKASRSRLKETELKLAEREKDVKPLRKRLEWAESKLFELENEVKISRYRLEESENKVVGHENELKEAKSELVDRENELNASRHHLLEVESKLVERENEIKASRNRFEEAECKLVETESRLKMAELRLEATCVKKEEAESRCRTLEAKLEVLHINVEKERDLSGKTEAKCRELENEILRLQHEVHCTKPVNRANEFRFQRGKQDKELALAGSKFAECQKTIASLTRQLKTLATIDDFLIDINDS